MKVPFSTFNTMHKDIHNELCNAFEKVLDNGWFIQGQEYDAFEKNFAEYCQTRYCVGVGNGLESLSLTLKAMGIGEGDEVIVPSHTFIATALAVKYTGAKPVFVEIHEDTYLINEDLIEDKITDKTKAIIVVQLYGQMAQMKKIMDISKKYNIPIIEDAAQAHGAEHDGKRAGSYGFASGFSFYPGKNLGALGDAGAMVTNDKEIYDKVRALSNYGSERKYVHKYQGVNSRLDELQAAFLNIKLAYMDRWTEERIRIANRYYDGITNNKIILPKVGENNKHVYHIFAIRCDEREKLQQYLADNEIGTVIHYPIAMHMQEAFSDLGLREGSLPIAEKIAATELSLPLYIGMTDEEIDYVINCINAF